MLSLPLPPFAHCTAVFVVGVKAQKHLGLFPPSKAALTHSAFSLQAVRLNFITFPPH